MDAVTTVHDGHVQMIDSSSVRVHQHAANSKKAVEIVVWAAPRRTDHENPRPHRRQWAAARIGSDARPGSRLSRRRHAARAFARGHYPARRQDLRCRLAPAQRRSGWRRAKHSLEDQPAVGAPASAACSIAIATA